MKPTQNEIELTWGDIRNNVFLAIIQRMIDSKLPFEVTVKMLLVAKKINDERALANVVLAKMEKEYTKVVKEEGKPEYREVLEEKKAEYEAEYAKYITHTFTVRTPKFPSIALKKLELTVNELLAIRPLLSDADDLFGEVEEVVEEKPTETKLEEASKEASLN